MPISSLSPISTAPFTLSTVTRTTEPISSSTLPRSTFSTSTTHSATYDQIAPSSSTFSSCNCTATETGIAAASSGVSSNTSTVITLAVVLSVVGLLVIFGGVALYSYCRQKRKYPRGTTPIDDDEIEGWRNTKQEKHAGITGDAIPPADHRSRPSRETIRKMPSTIIYPSQRRSEEQQHKSMYTTNPAGDYHSRYGGSGGRRSSVGSQTNRKTSLDKILPPTPIQALAPNARQGLTDEQVPGAEAFIAIPPQRTLSRRLSKNHPVANRPPVTRHNRRSSGARSSIASPGKRRPSFDQYRRHTCAETGVAGGHNGGGGAGEVGVGRTSDDSYRSTAGLGLPGHGFGNFTTVHGGGGPDSGGGSGSGGGRSRSSSYEHDVGMDGYAAGRFSAISTTGFGNSPDPDEFVGGGLSPRPLLKSQDIGRAIG